MQYLGGEVHLGSRGDGEGELRQGVLVWGGGGVVWQLYCIEMMCYICRRSGDCVAQIQGVVVEDVWIYAGSGESGGVHTVYSTYTVEVVGYKVSSGRRSWTRYIK